jgi:hypothetical protein
LAGTADTGGVLDADADVEVEVEVTDADADANVNAEAGLDGRGSRTASQKSVEGCGAVAGAASGTCTGGAGPYRGMAKAGTYGCCAC